MSVESMVKVQNAENAFQIFQQGLSRALHVSKEELARRVAQDNAVRTADRVQRGYRKRGPKPHTK